jgi:transmembrane 9 superfamily protein 3
MMVIFLVALVAMILMRTLKRDFAKFNKDPDDLEVG